MEFDQLLGPGLDVSLAGGSGAGACVAAVSPLLALPAEAQKPFPSTHNLLPPRCQ